MKKNQIFALLLILALSFSLFSGCREAKPYTPEEIASQSESEIEFEEEPEEYINPRADGKTAADVTPDYLTQVAEKKALNSDTVGWLEVPGLGINDVVVCNFEDNDYYLRLNFEKEYDFNGLFYADRRSAFGDGSRDQIGHNICIYGHALTDNPEDQTFNIKFGPLHMLRQEEIAEKTPYIFFSTEKENLAYEIFAVFTADSKKLSYNRNDLSQEELYKLVTEEVVERSIYKYDVDIKPDDKFLTLSTCIYELPNGAPTHYPDTYYRFGVMARLVRPEEALKDEASFILYDGVRIDPDKYPRG